MKSSSSGVSSATIPAAASSTRCNAISPAMLCGSGSWAAASMGPRLDGGRSVGVASQLLYSRHPVENGHACCQPIIFQIPIQSNYAGRVGLEPTTGGLLEACRDAPDALPARIPRSRAADNPDCTDCPGWSVHEPVHGKALPSPCPATVRNVTRSARPTSARANSQTPPSRRGAVYSVAGRERRRAG